MSFWNKVGKAAIGAVQHVAAEAQKREDTINRTQSRVANKSDREVVDKLKRSSGLERQAYARELEDRGYLEKNEEGKYQRTDKYL
ncbi:hypothetical protein GI482_16990 [Bacillus sp. N3536]|nr:hypothetical protein GI482_16990 [Bacillus sp. N3536]